MGARGSECGSLTRCGIEDDEADLVFGDVDRAAEADANAGSRQLVSCGTGTTLTGCASADAPAREKRFDEVARHSIRR